MANPLVHEFSQAVHACRARLYPGFVFGKPMRQGEVPAFVFHRVRAPELEDGFRHLSENGYHTLNTDDFCDNLDRTRSSTGLNVLLTFDDGFEDFYRIVFPLLMKYRLTAVLYLIPDRAGQEGMLSWPQIIRMHESGLVDVQSHSMHHPAIFVSDELKGVCDPSEPAVPSWNFPVQEFSGVSGPAMNPQGMWPVFPIASRFGDRKRFIPDAGLIRWMEEAGPASGARRNFRRLSVRYRTRTAAHSPGRFETDREQEAAIRDELIRSREAVEERLRGKRVRHFAYPWFEWGRLSEKILRETEYRSSAIGLSAQRPCNQAGMSPYLFTRVSGDFIRTLPGRGRRAYGEIIVRKAARRLVWGRTA